MHFQDFVSQLTEQKLENVSVEDMLFAAQHKKVTKISGIKINSHHYSIYVVDHYT